MATSKTSPTAGETKAEAEGNVPSGDVTPVISVNGAAPDQSDPKGAEVSTTADEVPKMSELTGIRYVGYADKKSFSVEDLQALGVEDPKEPLEWSDAINGKVVQTSQFNAATRDALLALPDFVAE